MPAYPAMALLALHGAGDVYARERQRAAMIGLRDALRCGMRSGVDGDAGKSLGPWRPCGRYGGPRNNDCNTDEPSNAGFHDASRGEALTSRHATGAIPRCQAIVSGLL